MSKAPESTGVKRPFQRPKLKVTGPDRRARGFYRTADNEEGTLAGLPLGNAEEATVSAVRLGYKVAAAQIERSGRLARRLRDAGKRAVGPEPERQALDATERLLFDSMMTGLEWLEGAAAEPSSPLKRLAAAEYRLLGSLFGLTGPGGAAPRSKREATATGEESDTARMHPRQARGAPARIFLQGKQRRAVRLKSWEVAQDLTAPELPVTFYCVQTPSEPPLGGKLLLAETPPRLQVTTDQSGPSGPWRAAVCLPNGEQMGIIEIEL